MHSRGPGRGLWRRVLVKGHAGRPPLPKPSLQAVHGAMALAAAQRLTEAEAEALVARAERAED